MYLVDRSWNAKEVIQGIQRIWSERCGQKHCHEWPVATLSKQFMTEARDLLERRPKTLADILADEPADDFSAAIVADSHADVADSFGD
jgi:hypothetical protein